MLASPFVGFHLAIIVLRPAALLTVLLVDTTCLPSEALLGGEFRLHLGPSKQKSDQLTHLPLSRTCTTQFPPR